MTDTRRVNRLLKWLDKQRLSHLDMVTDAGDASMWCKEEAELIRDHMKTVETMRCEIDELDFLRHEGGTQSVAAMESTMRHTVLPLLRRTAENLLHCVSVEADPSTISPCEWQDIAADLEAVAAVESFVGRPDDEYGPVLNPVLDARKWEAFL